MKKILVLVLLIFSFFSCQSLVSISSTENKNYLYLSDDDLALYMAYNAAITIGDINSAEKYIKDFLERVPDYEDALITLTSIYTFTKRYDEAFETINKVIQKNPENLDALMTLANIHVLKGDKKGAIPVLEKIVRIGVDKENYYIFLANVYIENKRFEEAEDVLLKLLVRFPNSFFGRVSLAKVYEEMNKNEEAAREYEKAFSAREEDEILINLDNIYDKLGERKKSIEVLEKFIQRNPDYPKVRERLALLYLGENNYDKSLEHIDIIIRQFPDNLDLLHKAAFIALDGDRLDRAKQYIDRILEKDKKSEKSRYIAGLYYKEIKDWEKVIYYLEGISSEEYYKSARLNLSIAYEKLKRNEDAYRILKEIWDKDRDPDAGYFLSLYLKGKKRFDEALILIDELMKGGDTRNNRLIFVKAEIFLKLNKFEEAISLVEDILKRNPDDPDALNFIGYSLLERGLELEKAYNYITKALQHKPDDPYITDSLAWYYYVIGKYQEAYELIIKSYEKLKDDPTILEHIGDILIKLNRPKEAKKFYEEALKYEPEHVDTINKKLEELKNF